MTDHAVQGDATALLEMLPAGTIMCLRDYALPGRAAVAARLAATARARRIRLLIGKDARLAIRVGAWGVHIPEGLWRQAQREVALAKAHGLKVTTAVHSMRAAHHAARGGAGACDAMVVSPVFATHSHPEAPPLGVTGLRRITAGQRLRAYALGGVSAQTLPRLSKSGVTGAAGIRMWCLPACPRI